MFSSAAPILRRMGCRLNEALTLACQDESLRRHIKNYSAHLLEEDKGLIKVQES